MKINGRIVLSAKVLLAGVIGNEICPVCGGNKSREAFTCKECYQHDRVVTKAVKAFDKARAEAVNGHAAAMASGEITKIIDGHANTLETQREIILPHFLANVRIPRNAQMRYPTKRGIEPYLEFINSVDGGFVKMFLFGATKSDIGKEVAAVIEMKVRRDNTGNEVPYLRGQLTSEVMSTVDLTFTGPDLSLPNKDWASILKRDNGEERALLFTVGFKPVEVQAQ